MKPRAAKSPATSLAAAAAPSHVSTRIDGRCPTQRTRRTKRDSTSRRSPAERSARGTSLLAHASTATRGRPPRRDVDRVDATDRRLLLRASRHEFVDRVEERRDRLPRPRRSEDEHVLAARNARPPQLLRRRRAPEAFLEPTRTGRGGEIEHGRHGPYIPRIASRRSTWAIACFRVTLIV